MNSSSGTRTSSGIYFLAVLGTFLIVGAMAWLLYLRTRPPAVNQARIEERIKNLHDINAAGAEALNTYGWQDQSKQLVRLPITNAMDLVVREWKNPAAARSNLLARVDKANPAPAPAPPPTPTKFE